MSERAVDATATTAQFHFKGLQVPKERKKLFQRREGPWLAVAHGCIRAVMRSRQVCVPPRALDIVPFAVFTLRHSPIFGLARRGLRQVDRGRQRKPPHRKRCGSVVEALWTALQKVEKRIKNAGLKKIKNKTEKRLDMFFNNWPFGIGSYLLSIVQLCRMCSASG